MKQAKGKPTMLISIILLSIIITIVFGFLTSQILAHSPISFDDNLGNTIKTMQTPLVIKIMKVITFLGSTSFLPPLLLVLIYLFYKRWGLRRQSFILALNLAGGYIITEILKSLVQRPRPALEQLTHASGFSFPSNHAMVSLAFYGLLSYLIWKNVKTPSLRWGLATLLFILGIVIGGSRIFLGVHYPSDVLGGYLLGFLWLNICIVLLEFLESRPKANN